MGYRRAQRDMGCRYAVGFYLEPKEVGRARAIDVRCIKAGLEARSPETYKLLDEEQRRENRLRAAMVDPKNFENPYVRAHAFPIRPQSSSAWNALLALHFRMNVAPTGNDLDVGVSVERGWLPVGDFREQFHIDPSTRGEPRPVTIYGDAKLKPGLHKMTIVLSEPTYEQPQTTTIQFRVPEIPKKGEMFIRGPVLGRAVSDGVLIRTAEPGAGSQAAKEKLMEIIGEKGTFEPLLVQQIESDDTVLALWEACILGGKKPPAGAVAERFVTDKDGEKVHDLGSMDMNLEGKGKIHCQGVLDSLPANTLDPGRYRIQVVVKQGEEEIGRGLVPLMVEEPETERASR
jgi:hypothetical protein